MATQKTRYLLLHVTVTEEGDHEPMLTVTRRVPWPQDRTLQEVADALSREACAELHLPEKQWVTA